MKSLNRIKLNFICAIILVITGGVLFFASAECVSATSVGKNLDADDSGVADEAAEVEAPASIVVVIDPGHGGKNAGASPEGFVEKEMTLRVAKAMRDELSKYEGIEVYLTREEDADLSLEERVEFAVDQEADFLFCLHFNMSETHELYGAECWVSMFDTCYARGYDFSRIEMELLTDVGLYDRGIKTRENSKGTDYYGIIRIAKKYDMPAVIIEHCHLDHANDAPYVDTDAWPERYGVLDATAVAKYYGLKSSELGVDYSTEIREATPVPTTKMRPDETPPEVCEITLDSVNEKNGEIQVTVTASDADTRILYYKYSLDGGITYSEFMPWQKDTDSVSFTTKVHNATETKLLVKAVNLYGFDTASEIIHIDPITYLTDLDALRYGDGTGVDGVSRDFDQVGGSAGKTILAVILIVLLVLCVPVTGFFVLQRVRKR